MTYKEAGEFIYEVGWLSIRAIVVGGIATAMFIETYKYCKSLLTPNKGEDDKTT